MNRSNVGRMYFGRTILYNQVHEMAVCSQYFFLMIFWFGISLLFNVQQQPPYMYLEIESDNLCVMLWHSESTARYLWKN